MRLVRFEDESGGFAVDLHPLITVISGLPAHVRERLVHGLASLPRGTDPGGRGSIEVHGVYLDLNRESLELLELNQDLDVILRSSDLPGGDIAHAEAPVDEPTPDLVPSGGDDEEIREAKRIVAEHDDAYEAAVRAVDSCRNQLAEIESEQAALNQQLSQARTGLDSFATAGLKVAREELAELAAAAGTVVAEPDTADRERIESRLSVLIEESDRLKRLVKSLRAIDPTPVRQAFAALEETGGTTAVSSPEAEALIDEWNEIDARLAQLESAPGTGRTLLDQLTSQRDEAYDRLKAAERNLRSPELDPARVDRLEAIHDEIFELDGRPSRFGAGKQRRRLDALRTEERELLLELGFDSWSSYIMGITSAGTDPARRRAFDSARHAYEQAEGELARVAAEPPTIEVDPELERWEAAREDAWTRIVALLGRDPGDDPVSALEAFRIDVSAPGASSLSPEAATDALRDALEDTGAEMPDREMTLVELKSLAMGWLETMELLPQRIVDVEAERDEIEVEIGELATEFEALPPVGAVLAPPAHDDESPELLAARERVADGEVRVRAHEDAVALIARIEAQHEQLDERAREIGVTLADREPRVATLLEQRVAARNRLRRAESNRSAAESSRWENRHLGGVESSRYVDGSAGAEAVEWYVLARLAQQRSVSFVGSVPLVIDDAFVNWPIEALGDVFTRLERMGEVIQIVYLTDDPEVGSWARSLGSDRALVLDMRVAS